MKSLLMVMLLLVFVGCAKPKPCEPITFTKKCETKRPIKPHMSDDSGDNTVWLRATLENSPKKDSYIYDLEAALEKCL